MICCVCERDWPPDKCEILVLTEAERAHVQSLGTTPPSQYVYCGPCSRVLSDKVQGAQLIKGTIQLHARAAGVSSPEKPAQQFLAQLLELGKKPKS